MLRSIGITPVLSDDKLSAFEVLSDKNSIETCLVNLKACDEAIVLLDRRYGSSLKGCGFADVSATHLEYQTAKEAKMPIRFFVRDRTFGEWSTWKKNKRPKAMAFMWVSKPEDHRLFEMLDEHEKLQKTSSSSNWYDTFTTSMDLKAAVQKYFEPKIISGRLTEAFQNNTFPVLHIKSEATQHDATYRSPMNIIITTRISNVGGAPAFNCKIHWDHDAAKSEAAAVFCPGQSMAMTTLFVPRHDTDSCKSILCATYNSSIGVKVCDEFEINFRMMGVAFACGGLLKRRRFIRSESVEFEVEERE